MNLSARAIILGCSLGVLGTACGPVLPGPSPARCTANPCSSVNLSSDPRTLQDRWVGFIEVPQVSGETPKRVPVTFDLSAQYKDEFFYTVSGTAQLEGKSYSVRGTPTFNYDEKILKPQYSPIPYPPFFELFEGDAVVYTVPYLSWQKDKNRYEGNFSRQNPPAYFSLTLERPVLPPVALVKTVP